MHKREEFSVRGGRVIVENDGDGLRIIFVREGKEESACPDLYVERNNDKKCWEMFAHSEENCDAFMRVKFEDCNIFFVEPESSDMPSLKFDLS